MRERVRRGWRLYRRHLIASPHAVKRFLAASAFFWLGDAIVMLLWNLYFRQIGYDQAQIGSFLSWGAWGAVSSAIPSIVATHRLSQRSIVVGACALARIGQAAAVFMPGPALIIPCVFAASFGQGLLRLSTGPILMDAITVRQRSSLFAVSSAIMIAMGIAGSLIGGWLPALLDRSLIHAESLRIALLTGSAIGLLGLIPAMRLDAKVRDPLPMRWEAFHVRLVRGQPWAQLGRLILPGFIIGLGAGLIIPFLNLYFRDEFNLTTAEIGHYFAIQQAMMVAGILLGPAMVRRWGMVRALLICQLGSIPFFATMALTTSQLLAGIAYLFRGTLMNMGNPIQTQFTLEQAGRQSTVTANALTTVSWNLAWALSTAAGGAIIVGWGYRTTMWLAVIMYLIAASLLWAMFRHVEGIRERTAPATR